MKIKENIDLIGKKIDIIKSKSLGFMAMAGGSWIYTLREDVYLLSNVGLWMVFTLSAYGVLINFVKFSMLYKELERLENDTF